MKYIVLENNEYRMGEFTTEEAAKEAITNVINDYTDSGIYLDENDFTIEAIHELGF